MRAYDRIIADYPDTESARRARGELALYRGLLRAEQMYPVRRVFDVVVQTARALERYRVDRRGWPETLQQLAPRYLERAPLDPWGQPLLYRRKPSGGYLLASLGQDGRAGGAGESADLFVEDGEFVERPSVSWP